MDLLGNEILSAHTTPADRRIPDYLGIPSVFIGFVLPRTARDYEMEKAVDKMAKEWRKKYSLPEPQQEPML